MGNRKGPWFNLTKPKDQYDHLPLPGVTVSESGLYSKCEEGKTEYLDFYFGNPMAMTARLGEVFFR